MLLRSVSFRAGPGAIDCSTAMPGGNRYERQTQGCLVARPLVQLTHRSLCHGGKSGYIYLHFHSA